MKAKTVLCSHMKFLQKKAVKKLQSEPPIQDCYLCASNQPSSNIICLHCNFAFCFECLPKHQTQESKHIFSLNLSFFLLNCKECQNDIQWMIDCYEGKKTDEGLQRMQRFLQFVKEVWIKLAIIYGSLKKQNYEAIKGLVNLGNTCFLNATLQVLSTTKPLANLYKQLQFGSQKIRRKLLPKAVEMYYDEILENNQNEKWHTVSNKKQRTREENYKFFGSISTVKSNKFNAIFSKFIHQKFSNDSHSVEPLQILNKLCQFDDKYTYKQEQDAEQLLILFLNCLSQGQMLSLDVDDERYKNIEKILGSQKLTMTQNMFGSYIGSQVTCQQCKKQSWTLDLTYHYSIPISKKKTTIIQQNTMQDSIKGIKFHKQLFYPANKEDPHSLIEPFFRQQFLSKYANDYTCESCSENNGIKKLFIIDQPKILVISLKRFEKQKKIKDFVPFPQTLDISMVCLSDREEPIKTYNLYGVIVHEGQTLNSGHYVSYVKTGESWHRCSDEYIRSVKWSDVRQKEAYILFYQISDI